MVARVPGPRRAVGARAVTTEVSPPPGSARRYDGWVSTPVRALRDGAVVSGLLFLGYLFVVVAPGAGTFGFDAFAYWAVDATDPYRTGVGGLGAFNYSPPIATVFGPFGLVPWGSFLWVWTALLIGNLVWLGGRGIRVLWLLALPPVALELYHGNIHLWIAAAIVLGFRYPWTWAFVLLTKVTPGVALVWFAVRREWRSLAIAAGVTGAIVVVSVLVDPGRWGEWFAFLGSTPEGGSVAQFQIPIPLWVRLPIAVVVVAWGARTDRRWTVPLGATLALPVLWVSGFAICAACLLLGTAHRRDPDDAHEPSVLNAVPIDTSSGA